VLIVDQVGKYYQTGGWFSKQRQHILKSISFLCNTGECLGIIGESGSGKSTLARLMLGIEKPDYGSITFHGEHVQQRKVRRGSISAVFQDYTSSINPFFTVEQAIIEPIQEMRKSNYNKEILDNRIDELLEEVGLDASYRSSYPHELSGGEIQRVCIARALATEPQCIVFDEAISSLDATVQFQVLELLRKLKANYQMSYIFITHDIQAASYLCDRLIIFRDGSIEEIINTAQLNNVQSEYAKALLSKMITL